MSDASNAARNRPYGGVANDARVAERRQRLLEVGLDILGGRLGAEGLTLRTICGRASLAQRYFYESFSDKDDFAAAVYDWALANLVGTVHAALQSSTYADGARTGMTALVQALAADSRIGHLLFSPNQTNPVVVVKRFESTAVFVSLFSARVSRQFRPEGDDHPPLAAHFLVGGVAQCLAAWLNGDVSVSQAKVIDEIVQMLAMHGVDVEPAVQG
ncbi:TetR/AcrR family transcriptional regulator [Mycobacterium sp. LTG2003]